MTVLVATFKPKSCKDWSYYCRLRVDVAPGSNDSGKFDGTWSLIDGPFFPFSKDHPSQNSSGVWFYGAGDIVFTDDSLGEGYLALQSVHWNFRILCSHRELQGKGVCAFPPTPDDKVVWVMGPGVKHPQHIETADRASGRWVSDGMGGSLPLPEGQWVGKPSG